MSASSIDAVPLNSPDSAISTSRQLLRLASTLPSMISLSQDVISPERVISRPTVSLRTSPSLRRDWAAGSPGRRIGSAGRIAIVSPARARSGERGGIVGGFAGPLGPGLAGPAPEFAPGPLGRAGIIGMPRSSDASAILWSSASVFFLPNMDGTPDRHY